MQALQAGRFLCKYVPGVFSSVVEIPEGGEAPGHQSATIWMLGTTGALAAVINYGKQTFTLFMVESPPTSDLTEQLLVFSEKTIEAVR